MAELSLTNIVKRYGSLEIIHGANLEVKDGEFVVFVGPSGCGKSTLLRMIAGLEDITGGELKIGGRVVNDMEPADRGIAMVFQSYALYPHLTVEQNLNFGLRMNGNPKADTDRRVKQAAEILQITELMQRRPKQLSGGQRQRVAIGRAIVRQPKVFLFDEPLSNLDAALRVRMRYEFAGLHKALGTTMIYVTHDQVEAMTLADRIVVLNGGVIEQVGTPDDLYQRPDTMFVAGFIGSPTMNLIPVTYAGPGANGATVRLASGQVVETAISPGAIAPGAALTLGVRPEHLRPDGAVNRLTGIVRLVESLGAVHHVHLAVDGLADPLVASLPVRPATELVGIVLEPEALHLFDEQGRALPRPTPGVPRAAA